VSSADLPAVLAHLEALVACDTENPPRAPDAGGVLRHVREALRPGFVCEDNDLGDGCLNLLAVRGRPRLLFNCHLDTVPAAPGWSGDPLRLEVRDGRAAGLGACDVKGAAAALLAAAAATSGPAALLFTTDEEHGTGRCVSAFLERQPDYGAVVVAEPTGCRAVTGHRGIASVGGVFSGPGGHASRADADRGALHQAVRWAAGALEAAARHGEGPSGVRFNLGLLRGGDKANMVAARAEVAWGVRPPPEVSLEELVAELSACAPDPAAVTWERRFTGPQLPASPGVDAAPVAHDLGLPPGPAVDFWTEAALFSQAGIPALVFGPGHIEQAHAAGEWVALDQLAEAAATYRRLLDGGGA